MAFRQSVGYRILLMVMSLACLGAAGYLVWLTLKPTASLEEIYKQAEASYIQGEEAYKGGNFTLAAEKFDAGRKQVEQVLGNIQKQREQAKSAGKELPNADEVDALEAKAHYLRARSIRDKHYAKAGVDEKPIPESLDTSTGEKYRTFMRIADPKDREEAVLSLLHAARVLTKEAAILKDAVRFELSVSPIEWERLSKTLNAVLELDPKDSRAYYWLARFDFFQPQKGDKGWADTEPSKRSQERVERSLRQVRKAKELGTQPPWRILDLEVRALEWLVDNAPKRKSNQPNPAEVELRALILHPSDGAVARIRKAEKLELPTSYDLQGVLNAYLVAVRLTVQDIAKPGGDRKLLTTTLRGFLDAVPKVRDTIAGKERPADVTQGLLEAIAAGQAADVANVPDWPEVFDKYLDAAAETKAQNSARPGLTTLMTSVLGREIRRSVDKSDRDREKKLKKRQADLLETAVKEAESSKVSRAELDVLHAMALELKLLDGAPVEAMTPHIQALTTGPGATRSAIASFAQGIIAWREGRLLKARDSFEAALRFRESVDFLFGAQWLLYQIYNATGQTSAALNALRDTETYFNDPNRRSALDRLALADSPFSPDDFVAHLAAATIEVSRQSILKHLKENPDAVPPAEITAAADKTTEVALKKLKTPSAADLHLRLAHFRLRQLQQRKDLADEAIKSLRRDYANSVAVLAAEANWLATPRTLTTDTPKPSPEGIKEADTLIEEFCATRPRDVAAKLFRIEWLVRTGRTEAALDLLKEPLNLDAATGAELFQAFAHLRGYPVVNAAAREILESQPTVADLLALLIQAIADEQRDAGTLVNPFGLGEARGRQALRVAARELAAGRFEEAARGFVESSSMAALVNAVREGLWQTVRTCAAIDPSRARNLCVALAEKYPDEPALYRGAAIACLLSGEVGQTRDSWERTKSMAAALNRWEQFSKKSGADPAELAMTRAQYWIAAARPNTARDEAARAMVYDAYNPSALVFAAREVLADDRTEVGLKMANKYWNTAVAVDPDDLGARCLGAELKLRRGELTGAIRTAQDVVRDHPRSSRAHETLVQICLEKKDGDEVFAALRQWIKDLPCDVVAVQRAIRIFIQRGRAPEAQAIADEFLAGCGAEIARRINELKPTPGGIAFENWERNAKVVSDRAQGEAWLNVISAFREAGQVEGAVARLRAALDKNPDSEVLLILHAEMAAAAERWNDADAAYRRILARNPRHERAAVGAIRLTAHLMDADAAFRLIKAYGSTANTESLDPQAFSLEMLLAIGEVHEHFTSLPHRSAIRRVMVDSLQRFPNDPRIQLYAGQLYYAMGDGMRAGECLNRALRLTRADEGTDISAEERRKIAQAVQQALDRLKEDPKMGNSDV